MLCISNHIIILSGIWLFSYILNLTHRGWVTHICVSKLTIIGSDNGLSPDRRQAIIWTNAGLLLIGPLGTNFGDILIEIWTFSFKKMRLKVSWPFCLGLNVLMAWVSTRDVHKIMDVIINPCNNLCWSLLIKRSIGYKEHLSSPMFVSVCATNKPHDYGGV